MGGEADVHPVLVEKLGHLLGVWGHRGREIRLGRRGRHHGHGCGGRSGCAPTAKLGHLGVSGHRSGREISLGRRGRHHGCGRRSRCAPDEKLGRLEVSSHFGKEGKEKKSTDGVEGVSSDVLRSLLFLYSTGEAGSPGKFVCLVRRGRIVAFYFFILALEKTTGNVLCCLPFLYSTGEAGSRGRFVRLGRRGRIVAFH